MNKSIPDEKTLLDLLTSDVKHCSKTKIVFQAGHFPLFYKDEIDSAIEGISYWGEFSRYTLELACKVGAHARSLGISVNFVVFVDDHSYGDISGLSRTKRGNRRDSLYRQRSGVTARLPDPFHEILADFGFNEESVARHNHGKEGREACLYFSELILRASDKQVDNACAREYVEFVDSPILFNKQSSYLISFVPQRCISHICNVALDNEIVGLSASHVFMDTLASSTSKDDLYRNGNGVTYRKD